MVMMMTIVMMAMTVVIAISVTIWRNYNNFESRKPYSVELDFKGIGSRS